MPKSDASCLLESALWQDSKHQAEETCIVQVTIGSIAAALLGFAGSDSKKEHQPTENLVEIIAMILLPVAVLMVAYALMVFVWRAKAIAKKQVASLSFLCDVVRYVHSKCP